MTAREFFRVYRIAKNPHTDAIYTSQVREKLKMIYLKPTYSSNKKWKVNFFFALGSWEFSSSEVECAPSVPRETNILDAEGNTQ